MVRIIPRLDIKGPNLVKGIHLEGLRVLGNPEYFAKQYYEAGADELIFQDVVASLYERNSLTEIIERTARNIFIPLTVGGGLRTLEDIKNVLRVGADKVSINTAAINRPEFIREATLEYGSSTICIALEVIKQKEGHYLCYTDNGREFTGVDALEWAKRVEELGAGELIITSIDREGTKKGMDVELIKLISNTVNIPIIAHGGVGELHHTLDSVQSGVNAICCATVLHYNSLSKVNLTEYQQTEGNVEFLKKGQNIQENQFFSIKRIKDYLNSKNVECRL